MTNEGMPGCQLFYIGHCLCGSCSKSRTLPCPSGPKPVLFIQSWSLWLRQKRLVPAAKLLSRNWFIFLHLLHLRDILDIFQALRGSYSYDAANHNVRIKADSRLVNFWYLKQIVTGVLTNQDHPIARDVLSFGLSTYPSTSGNKNAKATRKTTKEGPIKDKTTQVLWISNLCICTLRFSWKCFFHKLSF